MKGSVLVIYKSYVIYIIQVFELKRGQPIIETDAAFTVHVFDKRR